MGRRKPGTWLPALPLVVLITLTLVVAIARLRARPPLSAAAAGGPTKAEQETSLGAGPMPAKSRVPEHAARMQHGDPRRTHRARGRGPIEAHVAWKTDVGGAVEAQVVTSPDGKTLYAASLGGTLTALGLDGHLVWKTDLHGRVYSTPCVGDDGTIYVGRDGRQFFAITPAGTVRWKLDTEGDADTGAAIAPGGIIVFASERTVYGVRPSGDIAWRFHARAKVYTTPAIGDDGTVYVGSQDHHVYAIGPGGTLMWSADLGADVDGSPALGDDGALFVGTDADEIVRLGPKGDIVWRAAVGGYVRGPLAVGRDGDVLAGVYGPAPREVRVSAASGHVVGAFPVQGTGAREFGVHGGALEDDDGTLYFGAQDNAVYAVDRQGALRWRFATGADVDAPLTLLEDGSLVAGSDDGMVYLLAGSSH